MNTFISWVYFGYGTLENILEPLLLWSIYGDSLLLDFFAKALNSFPIKLFIKCFGENLFSNGTLAYDL